MQASPKRARALLLAGLLASGPAAAQQAPAAKAEATPPTETTATYQDWLMRCVAPAGQPRTCEVVQNLQIEGQGIVAVIAIGRAGPDSPLIIVIQVPQGVWLPGGMALEIGQKGQNGQKLPL
jgi:invasion protein IalB